MQVNVGRDGQANDLALALAFQEKIDILIIPKPWIGSELERKLSKKHNSYQAYAPEEEWKDRPRVMTYVRRGGFLLYAQKRQDILGSITSSDILVMKFRPSRKGDPFYIINIYNSPLGSNRAGLSAKQVMIISGLMQKNSIIMRDINLHHTDWDNRTRNLCIQARELADWISDNHATYELKTDTITHARDGTLDLVISSRTISDRITECYVVPELHTTSDHETLVTCLEVEGMTAKKPAGVKFRLEKMDENQFRNSLEGQKYLVRTSLRQAKAALEGGENSGESVEKLDDFAQKVTAAIHSSLELSTEKTKNSPRGEAW